MKMLLAGIALAAALGSPAMVQTANPQTYWSTQHTPNSRRGYVYPPDNHAHSPNPANDVDDLRGRYIGADPDPFIRDSLARGHGND